MIMTNSCKSTPIHISVYPYISHRPIIITIALICCLFLHNSFYSIIYLNQNETLSENTVPRPSSGIHLSPHKTIKLQEQQPRKAPKQFGVPTQPSLHNNQHGHHSRPRSRPRPSPESQQTYHHIYDEFDLYESLNQRHSENDVKDDNFILGSDCSGYYCTDTDTCVDKPIECPCPSILDIKSLQGDWYVCYKSSQHSY